VAVEPDATPQAEEATAAGEPAPARVYPAPRSLPRLRFGATYRLRARAVDLAGNDMAQAGLEALAHASPEVVYRRFEPVGSPLLFPRRDLKRSPGESVDRIVIRSNFDCRHRYRADADRHLAPPPVSEAMAEAHGMFDGPQGPRSDRYALIKARDRGVADAEVHREIADGGQAIAGGEVAGGDHPGDPGGDPTRGGLLDREGYRLHAHRRTFYSNVTTRNVDEMFTANNNKTQRRVEHTPRSTDDRRPSRHHPDHLDR